MTLFLFLYYISFANSNHGLHLLKINKATYTKIKFMNCFKFQEIFYYCLKLHRNKIDINECKLILHIAFQKLIFKKN